MRHNIQYQLVCFVHALRADSGEVTDATIYVVVNDAFYRGYALVFHSQDGGEYGSRYTAGELQGTARLGKTLKKLKTK